MPHPRIRNDLLEGTGAGWNQRMQEINKLHKEHKFGDNTTDDKLYSDPEEVYRHKRKQAMLSFEGTKKEGTTLEGRHTQVFKGLELKSVGMICKPTGLGQGNSMPRGLDAENAAAYEPEQGSNFRTRHSHQKYVRKTEVEKPIEIIIPLANDRVKTSAIHTDKALHIEYAARYLEKLGVSPTPANLQLISKHIPLEQCKIQQVFHPGLSKHEKKNYIIIKPNQKHSRATDCMYDPQNIPFESLPISLNENEPEVENSNTSIRQETDEDRQGAKLRQFSEYREMYVYPYNLRGRHVVAPSSASGSRKGKYNNSVGPTTMKIPREGSVHQGTKSNATTPRAQVKTDVGEAEDAVSENRKESSAAVASKHAPVSRAALTDERLRLQDNLVNLIKKGEQPLDEEEASNLREELEKRAAQGDLSALEFHPDMGVAECVVGELDSEPRKKRSKNPTSYHQPLHKNRDKDTITDKELMHPPSVSQSQIRELFQKYIDGFPFQTYWSAKYPQNTNKIRSGTSVNVKSTRPLRIPNSQGNDNDFTGVNLKHDDSQFAFSGSQKADLSVRIEQLSRYLQSSEVVDFEYRLVLFLYWSFLAPHVAGVSNKREARNFDERFVDVYQTISQMMLNRRSKSRYSMDLPLTILGIRVICESIFCMSYPSWSATENGRTIIAQMNELIGQLLDPVGYLSHISTVESSPQALKVMHKKKLPPRMSLSFTSPVIRFVVGDAHSKEAKALLSSNRSSHREVSGEPVPGGVFSLLTPSIRCKLLSIIASHKAVFGHSRASYKYNSKPSHVSSDKGRAPVPPVG